MKKKKNLRKILNFGHTFAHAYEATLGYTKKIKSWRSSFTRYVYSLKI